MRSIYSKYINRYTTLFNIICLSRGLDGSESLLTARDRIKSLSSFVSQNQDNLTNTRLYAGMGLNTFKEGKSAKLY